MLLKPCLESFSRPQQMNIMSCVRQKAVARKYDDLKIPKALREAQVLVGHDPGSRGPQVNPDSAM